MSTKTLPPDARLLRPATETQAAPAPASGAFSARNDPRLVEMKRGSALGTSVLALYPVFACVAVVLASLTLAGPSLPV